MEKNANSNLEERINQAIENVRPYLQTDGGDIAFVEITNDYVVKVKLLGACYACPMSLQTLKLGVERTIKNAVPEVKEVIAIDGELSHEL